MSEWATENWALLLAALAILLLAAWWIAVTMRRTRVSVDRRDTLDEGAGPVARNQALIDAPPAAIDPAPPLPPIVPEAVGATGIAVAAAAQDAMTAQGSDSELTRIKGLGPKLAATLAELGVTRIDQIAAWTEKDIDRIDSQLGRFQGRIRRDAWIEQAKLLAAGDDETFHARFGAV